MKRKRLFLMSGIPGSGKSTWIKNKIETDGGIWISRDAVRFEMIGEEDEYFSKEDEVFNKFVSLIQEQINNPIAEDIYIDATHLNEKGRNKVLTRLNLTNADEVNCVFFNIPLNVAFERNAQRSGRAFVPKSVIRRMFYSQVPPQASEQFNNIYEVNENGEVKKR